MYEISAPGREVKRGFAEPGREVKRRFVPYNDPMEGVLTTERLWLEPITLAVVEAVYAEDRAALEDIVRAKVPDSWPSKALLERAFCASLDRIRMDPETRLWGDRLMVSREGERRIVGSVVFHGKPHNGVVEVGYGVEDSWQSKGLASEGTRAQVEWALAQEGIVSVMATTPPWHTASIRVLERAGLSRVGEEIHEALGEVLVFERRR